MKETCLCAFRSDYSCHNTLSTVAHLTLTESVSTICTKGYKRLQYVAVWFLGLLSNSFPDRLDDRLLTFWASWEATFSFVPRYIVPTLTIYPPIPSQPLSLLSLCSSRPLSLFLLP